MGNSTLNAPAKFAMNCAIVYSTHRYCNPISLLTESWMHRNQSKLVYVSQMMKKYEKVHCPHKVYSANLRLMFLIVHGQSLIARQKSNLCLCCWWFPVYSSPQQKSRTIETLPIQSLQKPNWHRRLNPSRSQAPSGQLEWSVAKSPQAVRFKKKLPQLPRREVFTEEISSKYPDIFWLLDAFQKSRKNNTWELLGFVMKHC